MSAGDPRELVLLPSLRAGRAGEDGFTLTRKFIEGVEMIAGHWPGPVTVLLQEDTSTSTEMDLHDYRPGDTPATLEWRPADGDPLMERISAAATVFAFLAPSNAEAADQCRTAGVPMVCYSEYAPRTERQIVDADVSNPLRRWRRKKWLAEAERTRQRMVPRLAGLQCSGTPTFDLYSPHQPNTLLFFDNRVLSDQVIDDAGLERKARAVATGQPLRLAFGGRLIAMKGVRDLPTIAAALVEKGVSFTFDIYGSGPEEGALRDWIARLGLEEQVRMRGVLDFRTGWIPALRDEVDLFVCPHVQGDPSSTYPEVMSCGVPIAGYANEAFEGIVRRFDAGWTAPLGDAEALAGLIAGLDRDRDQIGRMARVSRDFARDHCFERTFAHRAAHLIATSRLPDRDRLSEAVQSRS